MTTGRDDRPAPAETDVDAARRRVGRLYLLERSDSFRAVGVGLQTLDDISQVGETHFHSVASRHRPLQPTIWTWKRPSSSQGEVSGLLAQHALSFVLSHGFVADPSDIDEIVRLDVSFRESVLVDVDLRIDGRSLSGARLEFGQWQAVGAVVDAGYAVTLVGTADFVTEPIASRQPMGDEPGR